MSYRWWNHAPTLTVWYLAVIFAGVYLVADGLSGGIVAGISAAALVILWITEVASR